MGKMQEELSMRMKTMAKLLNDRYCNKGVDVMSKQTSLERDIQTLGRTEGNLKFLIQSYIDGRVSYPLAKAAIANEVRFLERLIEVRLGKDYVLLTTICDLKLSPFKDEDELDDIVNNCVTLIAVSKIVLEELKEVR